MSNIFLNEDKVKEYVEQWLKNEKGYKKVDVNYGRKQGIDIKAYAQENIGEWVIEVKGSGNNKKKYPQNARYNNYFIGVLGELLQRMDKKDSKYSIALPLYHKYERLWKELPLEAKTRLKLSIIFVNDKGNCELVD